MQTQTYPMLNTIRYICGTLLTIGIILFFYGYFVELHTITGIGIGTVMGAVFIFIMGLFMEVTNEIIVKNKE